VEKLSAVAKVSSSAAPACRYQNGLKAEGLNLPTRRPLQNHWMNF